MHSIPQEMQVIFANSNTLTNEGLEYIESTNIYKQFFASSNTLTNESFGVHSIGE
jgi:1-deoxy-D-xylulose 5-phosphate reductoisomerase